LFCLHGGKTGMWASKYAYKKHDSTGKN